MSTLLEQARTHVQSHGVVALAPMPVLTPHALQAAVASFSTKTPGRFMLCVTAADVNTLLIDPAWAFYLDPVTRYERVRSGHVAVVLGIPVITDAHEPAAARWIDHTGVIKLDYTDQADVIDATPAFGAENLPEGLFAALGKLAAEHGYVISSSAVSSALAPNTVMATFTRVAP